MLPEGGGRTVLTSECMTPSSEYSCPSSRFQLPSVAYACLLNRNQVWVISASCLLELTRRRTSQASLAIGSFYSVVGFRGWEGRHLEQSLECRGGGRLHSQAPARFSVFHLLSLG